MTVPIVTNPTTATAEWLRSNGYVPREGLPTFGQIGNWHQWQEIIGVTGVFVLITVVLSIAIVQLASTWRAKAALAREHEYRSLAEKAVRTQEETERQLRDVQDRLRSIEHVLKEVD